MKWLEVERLIKTFKTQNIENKVLKSISFSVEKGEFVAIMGQSGSGKSTLLYNISGMDTMTSGSVKLAGFEIAHQSDDALAEIRLKTMGFVFQNNYLLKHLNIIDNICLPAFKANIHNKNYIIKRAEKLMKKMGILEIAHQHINKVSGGELQRAAVCRALINTPKILFADEPTGALNANTSREVMAAFNLLNEEGTTILMVTHDAKVAAVSDRIIYLGDGQIVDQLYLGKTKTIINNCQREEKTLYWLIDKGF